jgi:hypothetical protein
MREKFSTQTIDEEGFASTSSGSLSAYIWDA